MNKELQDNTNDKSDKKGGKYDGLLSNIWVSRDLGLRVPKSIKGDIKKSDVEYLINYKYPFIQVIDESGRAAYSRKPGYIELGNGWVIYDYGNAISTSFSTKFLSEEERNELLRRVNKANDYFIAENKTQLLECPPYPVSFDDGDDEDRNDDGGGDAGGGNGGARENGMIVDGLGTDSSMSIEKSASAQQWEVAFKIVELAKEKWDDIRIFAGSRLFQFFVWVAAQELGLKTYGFTMNDIETKKYKSIAKYLNLKREDLKQRRQKSKQITNDKSTDPTLEI